MTTTEHLQRIKAKCQQLRDIAAKRTPGRWIHHTDQDQVGDVGSPSPRRLEDYDELRKELEAMRVAINTIYAEAAAYADGAPDASAHDKFCNEIAAKLQPFLK